MPATDFPSPSKLEKPLPNPSYAAYVETRLQETLKRPALEFWREPHLQRHVLVKDATGSPPPA
jgi:hypothetical protein